MTRTGLPRVLAVFVTTTFLALALPLASAADDDRREVRVAGTCTGSSSASLRLRADEGTIRVEFKVETDQAGSTWRVILLHERKTMFRGTTRTGRGSGSFKLRREVGDWFGTDTFVARASGPRIEVCRATGAV